MALEHLTHLTCTRCAMKHPLEVRYTCPSCGLDGILDVAYDYEKVKRTLTREALAARPQSHWRYSELLPIDPKVALPHLQVGMTPVYEAPRLAKLFGLKAVWVKDDGRNPTASFKDRASSLAVVKAQEAGQKVIACASTGNAASSLAGFSAAVGLKSFIFVPWRAPEAKLAQLLVFGANVVKVKGTYEQAYDFCQAACEKFGWYNRNCAVNPYLVEGKKTAGLEIAEQMGEAIPDWVVFSVGDGCTLAGGWKGLGEMHTVGLSPRRPRLLGVQAQGAAPITTAWKKGIEELEPVEANTLADSIAVGTPRNWRKALRAIRESKGAMINVEDEEILEAMRQSARLSAVFAEPAGAAGLAGLAKAVESGVVGRGETALVVVTGNGLKDVKGAMQAGGAPMEISPDLEGLEAELQKRQLL